MNDLHMSRSGTVPTAVTHRQNTHLRVLRLPKVAKHGPSGPLHIVTRFAYDTSNAYATWGESMNADRYQESATTQEVA
jgi:hypothetical protein